jgi:hypothetical protein
MLGRDIGFWRIFLDTVDLLANSVVNSSPLPYFEKRFSGCFFGLGLGLVAGCG